MKLFAIQTATVTVQQREIKIVKGEEYHENIVTKSFPHLFSSVPPAEEKPKMELLVEAPMNVEVTIETEEEEPKPTKKRVKDENND